MRSTARAWPAGTAEASAAAQQETVSAAHLLLQQPGRGVLGLGLEGVGADELGEVGGLVRFGGANRAHLGDRDVATERGGLQCGFGTCESAADDVDVLHPFRIGRPGPQVCGALRQRGA